MISVFKGKTYFNYDVTYTKSGSSVLGSQPTLDAAMASAARDATYYAASYADITITIVELCETCGGQGQLPKNGNAMRHGYKKCPHCAAFVDGSRVVVSFPFSAHGNVAIVDRNDLPQLATA